MVLTLGEALGVGLLFGVVSETEKLLELLLSEVGERVVSQLHSVDLALVFVIPLLNVVIVLLPLLLALGEFIAGLVVLAVLRGVVREPSVVFGCEFLTTGLALSFVGLSLLSCGDGTRAIVSG